MSIINYSIQEVATESLVYAKVWSDVDAARQKLTESHLDYSVPPFPKSTNDASKSCLPFEWNLHNYTDSKFKIQDKRKSTEDVINWFWTSGSHWAAPEMSALHAVLRPVTDSSQIVPQKFMLGDTGKFSRFYNLIYKALVAKYPNLLTSVDKNNIIAKDWPDLNHREVDFFFSQLRKLLVMPNDARDDRDEAEAYTNKLWIAFAACFGVDSKKSNIETRYPSLILELIIVRPRDKYRLKLGTRVTAEVILDHGLWESIGNYDLLFCFEESKRKAHEKSQDNLDGQKVAEAIATAARNHIEAACWKTDVQEVFGIGIVHTTFEFYHSLVPRKYIAKLQNGVELTTTEYIELRVYRGVNGKGLDICDPVNRKEITALLDAIISYKTAGKPLIGIY